MKMPDFTLYIGGKPFVTAYMVMVLAGILFTLFYMMRFADKHGHDDMCVLTIQLLAFASALIGSHILGALVNFDRVTEFFRDIGSISVCAAASSEAAKYSSYNW